MRRIGVMGGMFDPVHNGHVAVALEALKALALDELRMVPCRLPNHRGPAAASAQDRLAMLELATRIDARLVVDDRECTRSGVSYTVETLESMRGDFPDGSLVLIMGADAFRGLGRWHRWQQLPRLAHLAVVSRPGVPLEMPAELEKLAPPVGASPARDTFAKESSQVSVGASPARDDFESSPWQIRQVDSAAQLFAFREGGLILLSGLQLDISSTQVRDALQSHKAVETLLPPGVADYIKTRGLYGAGQ